MKTSFFHFILYAVLLYSDLSVAEAGAIYSSGARAAALSNSGLTLTDIWSNFNNQACLASLKKPAAGFHYENRFLVKELSLRSIAIVLPVKTASIGINYLNFGYSLFHENKFGLSVSKTIFSEFSLGVQLDYFLIHIGEGSCNAGALAVEIGGLYNPAEKLTIATHLYNLTRSRYTAISGEELPSIFRFGGSYQATDELLFCIETEKELTQNPVLKGGIEYHIINQIALRVGVSSSEISRYSFGFGLQLKKFNSDIAFSYHPVLSFTPFLSISYDFK